MTSLGDLTVGIGIDTSGLIGGISQAKSMLGGFGGIAAATLVGAGIAAVGAGAAAVKMAGDFQTSMTQLATGAGESANMIGVVSHGILAIAPQVGTSTKDMAAGMYLIESAGFHAANGGLLVLQNAAMGAKVGAASLADVANGVTTALVDYGLGAEKSAYVTNVLIAAVAAGKTHMGDLSIAMSTVLPTAAAVHVSLLDTAGAMATMTGEGTNASAAATYLRQLLMALEAPASKGAKALTAIGLSSAQVSTEMRTSLPDALQLIMTHLSETYKVGSPQYIEALKNIAGGSKQMQGILELTGTHLSVFNQNVQAIAASAKQGGDSITGWSLVQQDFNFKMDQARATIEALGIKIGTALLPVVGHLFDMVSPLIQNFSDWADQGNNLQGMLTTVGSVIQDDVISPTEKLYNAIEPIIQDFITWNDKTHFIQNTLHDLGTFINIVATDIANNIMPPVRSLISNFEQWLTKSNFVHDALGLLGGMVDTTSKAVGTLVGWISSIVGWFASSKTNADLLKDAIFAIGGVILGVKIFQFGQDVFTMGKNAATSAISLSQDLYNGIKNVGSKIGDVIGKVQDFFGGVKQIGDNAKDAAPHVDDLKTSTDKLGSSTKGLDTQVGDVATSEEALGTHAETAAPEVGGLATETGSLATESELAGGPTIDRLMTSIYGVGTSASVADAQVKTLATDTAILGADAAPVGAELDTVAAGEEAAGSAAAAAAPEVGALSGMLGNLGPLAGGAMMAGMTPDTKSLTPGQMKWLEQHPGQPVPANFSKMALGGINLPAGQSYLAGEGGFPELITPAGSTNVLNGQQTAAMMAAGSDEVHVHLTVQNILDGRMLSEPIGHHVVQTMRRRTGTRV